MVHIYILQSLEDVILFMLLLPFTVYTMLASNHLQFPKLDPDPQLITARIPHLNTSRLWRLSSRKLRLAGKKQRKPSGSGAVFLLSMACAGAWDGWITFATRLRPKANGINGINDID